MSGFNRGLAPRIAALIFILTSLVQASYEKVTEKSLFNGEKLYEFKLPNGFRVLFVPRTQAEVLSYQTWFDVGSLDEKLDEKLKKTGLAHLFEHMMFRGTMKYPDGKFEELSSRMGADRQNASTYYYRTNYYQNIPSNKLEAIMELESDRMSHLLLDGPLLTKEKGAVVGELRRFNDNPMTTAWDEIHRLAFKTSPFQYTVIGTEAEIKGFTLDEANYFYRTFYAPNNAVLIIVGNTTEKALMELVEKYYGQAKAQEVPRRPIPEEPPQKAERKFEATHPQATSDILLVGYRYPGIDSPDIVPLSLLGAHLSTGEEARLRNVLVDNGIAVRASGGWAAKPDLFSFSVLLSEKQKATRALQVLDREIELLKQKPIDQDAFERALNQELLSLYVEMNDNTSLANMLGEYLTLSGNYMKGFEIIEAYKKLTPKDLQATAKKYFNRSNRCVVIVRPGKKGKS